MDPPDAAMALVWRYGSNGRSNTKLDGHVLNCDVLRAAIFCNQASVLRWLDGDSVVPVCDLNISDGYVRASWVDAVGVQRHGGPRVPLSLAREEEVDDVLVIMEEMKQEFVTEVVESFVEGVRFVLLRNPSSLSQDVSPDLQVVDVDAVDIGEVHHEPRTVEPLDAGDFTSLHPLPLQQVWPSILVLSLPFSGPPIVSKTVNNAFTLDRQVRAVLEFHEIGKRRLMVRGTVSSVLYCPGFMESRGLPDSINLQSHIRQVSKEGWHRRKSVSFRHHYPLWAHGVGPLNAGLQCPRIREGVIQLNLQACLGDRSTVPLNAQEI